MSGKDFDPNFRPPVLQIPQMTQTPVIDGRIGGDEWLSAACFTGLSGNPLGRPFLLPEEQQTRWFLGWRGDMLYIGMKSPHPKGTFPSGRIKVQDDPNTLFGDHVEIQICTHDRQLATTPGKGFYKMVVNAWGAMHDRHWYNGTPGSEDLWSTGGEVKCHVTDEEWQLELSISARHLKLDSLADQPLIIQLVRAGNPSEMFYAGWVGTNWAAWDKFAECTPRQSVPVVRLEKLGQIMAGELEATISVTGTGRQTVRAEIVVEDAAGQVIARETRTVELADGRTETLHFAKTGLPVSEVDIDGGRNFLEITVASTENNQETLLYRNRSPFMKMTPAWREKYWDPWVAGRPQAGNWDAVFAHWPYAGKGQAVVDTDFFGIEPRLKEAASFTVEVVDEEGKQQGRGLAEMHGGKGEVLLDVPYLAAGDYLAHFTLFDADNRVLANQNVSFIRRQYEWEHNRIGLGDEVIPPYRPMEVNPRVLFGGGRGDGRYAIHLPAAEKERTIHAWGSLITVGPYGLPSQIVVSPPTGTIGQPAELLAEPIRLALSVAGQELPPTAAQATITEAKAHRVKAAGGASFGPLDVQVRAVEEYDGWYEVELELRPDGKVTVDSLDLLVTLKHQPGTERQAPCPVDTLLVQRLGMGEDSFYGDLPAQPGIHFRSTSLLAPNGRFGPADLPKDWKSFAPITFVGNGDRGLWLFAWSDKGWHLADTDAALVVERLPDGNVQARCRFISGPVLLDAPRTIRFALQPTPMKMNDPRYRTRTDEIAHDTSGFRYYGDSVDGFTLHDDNEYDALRKFLLYGTRGQDEADSSRYASWESRLGKLIAERQTPYIMLYGSQWMTGLGDQAFRVFGGEWMGNNNWMPDPDLKFNGKWNFGQSRRWDTPETMMAARVNWPRSFRDYFLYHYDRLIAKVGFNGTWWDNTYGGFVTDYDPETGKLESQWNVYARRDLCKRLNVMGWQHLRPPCWSIEKQVDMAWCQVFWMVEGNWYADADDLTAFDHFDLGWFRASARPKSSVMITKPWLRVKGSTPEKDTICQRSLTAILLMHDIRPAVRNGQPPPIIRELDYLVDYANPQACLYLGYWGTTAYVRTPQPEIKATLYQNAGRRTAALLLVNTGDQPVNLAGTMLNLPALVSAAEGVPTKASGDVAVARVFNVETKTAIPVTSENGATAIAGPLTLPAHDYLMLGLE